MEGNALWLVESRPRTVRPVVALPVEEAPLEVRTLTIGGELDDFDREALGSLVGTVRIDAGEAGVAKEAYLHGLPLGKFLARERSFRPPVAQNGFGSWDDAECLAGPIASNRCARLHSGFMGGLADVAMDELYRQFVELEDPRCICPTTLAEAISNNVVRSALCEQSLVGAIDVSRVYVAVKHSITGKIDAGCGDPFTQLLLTQSLLNFHVKSRSNVVPPADATNLIRRITALAERYAQSPDLIAARELFYRAWRRHAELPEGAFGNSRRMKRVF